MPSGILRLTPSRALHAHVWLADPAQRARRAAHSIAVSRGRARSASICAGGTAAKRAFSGRHPHIGGLLLAVRGAPQHEKAYLQGSLGEESVARSLERRTAKGDAIVLHDRRMPASRANIDHLAIAPTGVYVIDAKDITGKVRVSRPLLGAAKLLVKGRNRSRLVDGLDRQVAAVRQALSELGRSDVPVQGVFCFTKADLPLLGSSAVRGHRLHHRRAVARKLNRSGPLGADAVKALAEALAAAFPSA